MCDWTIICGDCGGTVQRAPTAERETLESENERLRMKLRQYQESHVSDFGKAVRQLAAEREALERLVRLVIKKRDDYIAAEEWDEPVAWNELDRVIDLLRAALAREREEGTMTDIQLDPKGLPETP